MSIENLVTEKFGPLQGVKILSTGTLIAQPFAAELAAEMGAEVIQIERPEIGDVGWRSDRAELHLNITAAHSVLNGPGSSPVQLLAVDPSAQFTAPNQVNNQYASLSLNGTVDITDTTSVQARQVLRFARVAGAARAALLAACRRSTRAPCSPLPRLVA